MCDDCLTCSDCRERLRRFEALAVDAVVCRSKTIWDFDPNEGTRLLDQLAALAPKEKT